MIYFFQFQKFLKSCLICLLFYYQMKSLQSAQNIQKKQKNKKKFTKNTILLQISGKKLLLKIPELDPCIQELYYEKIWNHFPVIKSPKGNQKLSMKFDKKISVTNIEACSLIWRIFQKELNFKVEEKYSIFSSQFFDEVQATLQKVSLKYFSVNKAETDEQRKDENSNKYKEKIKRKQKSEDILKQLRKIENQMKQIMETKIKKQYDKQVKRNQHVNETIQQFMGEAILKLERQIFLKSILGIRAIDDENLVLIFQQSYPQITMKKKQTQDIIGKELVLQKMADFQNYFKIYHLQTDQEKMLNCHYCLLPISKFHTPCLGDHAVPQISSVLLTDPFMFFDKILCEDPFSEQIKEERKYLYPYLLYYRGMDSKKYVCGRISCEKCLAEEFENCLFCQGTCPCFRCSAVDRMVKMIGVFIKYGGDFQKIEQKFLLKFKPGSQCQVQITEIKKQKEDMKKNKEIIEYLKKMGIFIPNNTSDIEPLKYMAKHSNEYSYQEKKRKFLSRRKIQIPPQQKPLKQTKKQRIQQKKQMKNEENLAVIPKNDKKRDSDEEKMEKYKNVQIFEEEEDQSISSGQALI